MRATRKRRFSSFSVDRPSAVIAALTAAGFIVGAVVWGLGRGILVGLVVWLGAALIRFVRHPASTTVRLEESTDFPYPSSAIWAIVEPPEMAPLLFPNIRRGYRVPGTPAGVGEHHAFELSNGATMVIEVEELTPGHRAVIRIIEPKQEHFDVIEVDDTEHGCVYRHSVVFVIPARPRAYRKFVTAWRRETRDSLDRLRAALGSDAKS